MFGMYGSHDKRRLLAFHETHGGVRTYRQQVLAEEALYQREVLSQQALANHSSMYPALIALTMAIGTVLHDMTGTNTLMFIDLPEDDLATTGGSDVIVIVEALGCFFADAQLLSTRYAKPLPKGAVWRVALCHIALRQRFNDNGSRRLLYDDLQGLLVRPCPWLVAEELCGFVVVAAAVFMVAAPYPVIDILAVALCIDIAHEAALASAMRTGGFLLAATRHTRIV